MNNLKLRSSDVHNSASADLKTAGQFPTFKNVKNCHVQKMGRKILPLPAMSQELEISACEKVWTLFFAVQKFSTVVGAHCLVHGWNRMLPTVIHCTYYSALVNCLTIRKDIGIYVEIFNALIAKAAALLILKLPSILQCRDHFRASESKVVTFISAKQFCKKIQTRYIDEAVTKKSVKMLLATGFFFLHDVHAAVELLGRNVSSPVAPDVYFKKEWMAPNRIQLCNHFEEWHFGMNQHVRKHHLSFCKLPQLL
ncbi:hypothetical protein T4D_12378 [Trichinella pseudospiralis]|uniref:Uncharacterized protein n=1 Tax=Trichinella pseudospiralis TaxID=6337 RepID=A0A0V1G1U7_TRIPS|nr:hypothetical protein T4D_12378 [Trichinella pseudospiralis]